MPSNLELGLVRGVGGLCVMRGAELPPEFSILKPLKQTLMPACGDSQAGAWRLHPDPASARSFLPAAASLQSPWCPAVPSSWAPSSGDLCAQGMGALGSGARAVPGS